jgi:hypothetical protein
VYQSHEVWFRVQLKRNFHAQTWRPLLSLLVLVFSLTRTECVYTCCESSSHPSGRWSIWPSGAAFLRRRVGAQGKAAGTDIICKSGIAFGRSEDDGIRGVRPVCESRHSRSAVGLSVDAVTLCPARRCLRVSSAARRLRLPLFLSRSLL